MVNLQFIEKRNARERRRVQAVNQAFNRLRSHVPSVCSRNKRVSKVKIIHRAIQYIMALHQLVMLRDTAEEEEEDFEVASF